MTPNELGLIKKLIDLKIEESKITYCTGRDNWEIEDDIKEIEEKIIKI